MTRGPEPLRKWRPWNGRFGSVRSDLQAAATAGSLVDAGAASAAAERSVEGREAYPAPRSHSQDHPVVAPLAQRG